MDVFLSNMNGDALPPPLRVFWRSELFDELSKLEGALFAGHAVPRSEPFITEDEWDAFMTGFLERVPAGDTEIAGQFAALPRSPGARALRWRLRQTLEAIATLPFRDAPTGLPAEILPSHEALLPMRLRERLGLLLGYGAIPMVWIRRIDVARFPAPVRRPRPPE